MEIFKFGYIPDVDPNQRHYSFDLIKPSLSAYGSGSVDLRKFSSPRHNQLHSSSCVAQSTVKALEIKRIQKIALQKMSEGSGEVESINFALTQHKDLSRLALYYLAREMSSPTSITDDGAYIHLAAEALRLFGVCRESPDPNKPNDKSYWPFDLNLVNKSPNWINMREAYLHKISAWYKIYSTGSDRVDDVIKALRAGNPVIYGTTIGSNWSRYDGRPLQLPADKSGGHATVLVGWDAGKEYFWGENSWGENWGPDKGFYKISPNVIGNSISNDFIVITGGWEPWVKK